VHEQYSHTKGFAVSYTYIIKCSVNVCMYCIVLYYYFMKEVTPSAKAGINGEP